MGEGGRDSEAETEDRDTEGGRASQPDCVPARLLYADEQRVDSVTFLSWKKQPLSSVRGLMEVPSIRTHAHAHVSPCTRDPSCIMDVLSDAQWRTNTPGFACLTRSGTHIRQRAQALA